MTGLDVMLFYNLDSRCFIEEQEAHRPWKERHPAVELRGWRPGRR